MPKAEIISIGTELLLGEIPDTNMQFIARELRNIGVSLFRSSIVGDNKHRIAEMINEITHRADIIIITGGLGPTVDDPTREALAIASGLPLIFQQDLWNEINTKFNLLGKVPGENQKSQAYIPTGATPIDNPIGTAPSFYIYLGKCVVFCLPGVPIEMKKIFKTSIIPLLNEKFNLRESIQVRILHTFGVGEGWIDEKIADLERLSNPTVGLAAKSGIVDIRIAACSDSKDKSDHLINKVEAEIRERLGDHIFGTDDDTLHSVAIDSVGKRNWKVVTTEGGTEGLMTTLLANLNKPSIIGSYTFSGPPDQFLMYTRQNLEDKGADVAIGLNITTSENSITIHQVLLSPTDSFEKKHNLPLFYPNATEIGINMILNRLRRTANLSSKSITERRA